MLGDMAVINVGDIVFIKGIRVRGLRKAKGEVKRITENNLAIIEVPISDSGLDFKYFTVSVNSLELVKSEPKKSEQLIW